MEWWTTFKADFRERFLNYITVRGIYKVPLGGFRLNLRLAHELAKLYKVKVEDFLVDTSDNTSAFVDDSAAFSDNNMKIITRAYGKLTKEQQRMAIAEIIRTTAAQLRKL